MGLKGFLLTGSLLLLDLTNAQDCCQKKVVTAPAEHAGTFTFVRKFDGDKDSNCADACIYSKDGADGDEFCFKAVDTDPATIDEQCDATSTAGQTTGGTTGASTTVDHAGDIKKANEEIAESNKEIEEETENDATAESASSTVDGIANALDTGRKMAKRQSDSASTIAPLASISQCPDFGTRFKELLSNLKELDGDNADEKIPMIKELVRILNQALPNLNTLCDSTAKQKMKNETVSDVQSAKEKTTKYREKKKEKIKELVVKVQIAQHKIEESNQALVDSGFTKIPALQLPSAAVQFTVENPLQFFSTTPIGSSSGGSTPGGSTPGGSSPGSGGSTPGGSTPGGSTPGGSSPGGSSQGGSSPGGSSPGGSSPSGSTPGGSSPGGSSPGGSTPDGSSPSSGGSTPGGSSPGGSSPGGSTPGGSSPGGSSPDGSSPGGSSPGGSTPGGSSPGGSSPGGSTPGGSSPGGSSPGGSSPGGSSPGTSPRPTTRGPGRLKHFKDFKKFQH